MSTWVIALSRHVPATPTHHVDDRDDDADPRRVRAATGQGQPDESPPGQAALVALARLLGRQAAQEWFPSQEGCDADIPEES